MNEKEIIKWEKEYINDVDISNILWIKLNNLELRDFFEENYLDKELWKYVAEINSYMFCPIGLHYVGFDNPESLVDYSYLLGVVDNNKGCKTIVAAMTYLENYLFFGEEIKPITYINTVEVNHYFRNKGIFKEMCRVAINFINLNQHIIVSPESEMGKLYNTFEIFKNIMIKNGFTKDIWNERKEHLYDLYYYLKEEDTKILKKVKE